MNNPLLILLKNKYFELKLKDPKWNLSKWKQNKYYNFMTSLIVLNQ